MTEASLSERPPAQLPDKRQVAASFSRAAGSYDSVAALQRQVGNQLLARLPSTRQPGRWLDLGSGTGYFSRVLAAAFPEADGLALDIAEGMLRMHGRRAAHGISSPVTPSGCRCVMTLST